MSERHNDGTGKVARTCEICGKEFETFKAWLRGGKGGRFCSMECAVEGRLPRPTTMIHTVCKECGKEFSYRKGGKERQYCSTACSGIGRGKARLGKPRIKRDGQPLRLRSGGKERPGAWHYAVRKAVRERGACAECGATDDLQGHHTIPVCVRPDLGAESSNIEVLCANCHAKHHPEMAGMISRPRIRSGIERPCVVCGRPVYVKPCEEATKYTCSNKCARIRDAQLKRENGGSTGESSPSHKLTEEQVHEIRRLYESGQVTQAELARRFGVWHYTIWAIVHYKTWPDVKEQLDGKEER